MAKRQDKKAKRVREMFDAINATNRQNWQKVNQKGYDFYLDVGTQEIGAVGTIKIIFRWKQGQMVGFPNTTSDYKLVTKDWSGLLGKFEK